MHSANETDRLDVDIQNKDNFFVTSLGRFVFCFLMVTIPEL